MLPTRKPCGMAGIGSTLPKIRSTICPELDKVCGFSRIGVLNGLSLAYGLQQVGGHFSALVGPFQHGVSAPGSSLGPLHPQLESVATSAVATTVWTKRPRRIAIHLLAVAEPRRKAASRPKTSKRDGALQEPMATSSYEGTQSKQRLTLKARLQEARPCFCGSRALTLGTQISLWRLSQPSDIQTARPRNRCAPRT